MIHHDTFYFSGRAYNEGYDRIFGKKDEDETEARKRTKVQKPHKQTTSKKARAQSESTRRMDRSQKIRQEKDGKNGGTRTPEKINGTGHD